MVADPPDTLSGSLVDNHIILDIAAKDRHYWSPQLNFRVEPDEYDETKSVVSGLIGPRPPVWTLFMFIYFMIGALGVIICSFGLSRLLLGEWSPLLLALPIAFIINLTAYWVGKYGERLAADQTEILKEFVREALYLK